MNLKPVIPLFQLKGGEKITPKLPILDTDVKKWEYASECGVFRGTLAPSLMNLKVINTSGVSHIGKMWVRVEVPAITPPCILKLSGSEYSSKFWSAD
jgi:hypothetical protein